MSCRCGTCAQNSVKTLLEILQKKNPVQEAALQPGGSFLCLARFVSIAIRQVTGSGVVLCQKYFYTGSAISTSSEFAILLKDCENDCMFTPFIFCFKNTRPIFFIVQVWQLYLIMCLFFMCRSTGYVY